MTFKQSSLVLSSFLALSSLGSCQYLKETFGTVLQHPQVTVKEIQIVSMNLRSLKIKLKLFVQNPNTFALEFSKLNYEILLNQRLVAHGVQDEKVTLPGEGSTVVEVPVNISNTEASRALREAYKKTGALKLHIRGNVDFHTPLGPTTINFEHQKELLSP